MACERERQPQLQQQPDEFERCRPSFQQILIGLRANRQIERMGYSFPKEKDRKDKKRKQSHENGVTILNLFPVLIK